LSSAGVSGGREEWAGSGAVAAVAAATMPSRGAAAGRRSGYARRPCGNEVPAAPGSPPAPPLLRRRAASGLTVRLPASTRGSSELAKKQCYSLRSEVEILGSKFLKHNW
jgi:hypothetical protein